jgi:hypothetical protein
MGMSRYNKVVLLVPDFSFHLSSLISLWNVKMVRVKWSMRQDAVEPSYLPLKLEMTIWPKGFSCGFMIMIATD